MNILCIGTMQLGNAMCRPPTMLAKGSSGSKGMWNIAERGISGLRGSFGILQR